QKDAEQSGDAPSDALAGLFAGAFTDGCPLQLSLRAEGSLDTLTADVKGTGHGMTLDAHAELAPLDGMSLRTGNVALELPDGSSLIAQAGWEQPAASHSGMSVLAGEIKAEKLDVGGLSGGLVPPAVLGLDGRFRLQLDDAQRVRGVDVDVAFHEGSTWNKHP